MKATRINFLMAGVLCIALACLATPAGAVSVLNTTTSTVIFSDDFEGDTVGNSPLLQGADIGAGWLHNSTSDTTTNDVENNSTTVVTLESRVGLFGSMHNNGSHNGGFTALFSGGETADALEATFAVAVADNGDTGKGYMRIGFSNTAKGCSGSQLEECTVGGPHAGYIGTGTWAQQITGGNLPTGTDVNDVFMAYHQGGWNLASAAGGTQADAAIDNAVGKWIEVKLEQTGVAGSAPVFTLNGVEMDPIPVTNGHGMIDGIHFSANNNTSHGYVDQLAPIPEPTSAALLLMGIGGLLGFTRRRRTV